MFQRITVDTFIKLDTKPVQVLKTLEKWITNGLLSECPVTADRNHHDTRDILCKMVTVVHKEIQNMIGIMKYAQAYSLYLSNCFAKY